MPIELNDHLLNGETALVLYAQRDLEDSDLARILDLPEEQKGKLTVVVLSRTRVTGACLEYLACLPRLRELYLNGTQVSDRDRFELSGWALEVINLNDTRLGDKGVARLSGATNLRTVRLRNTRITDRGVKMLATFPRLRECYLDGTPTSNHAKRRLDNAIKMAHIDLAGALQAIGRHIKVGARLVAGVVAVPGSAGWGRGWNLLARRFTNAGSWRPMS